MPATVCRCSECLFYDLNWPSDLNWPRRGIMVDDIKPLQRIMKKTHDA